MLNDDSPIIQDLDASLRYTRLGIDKLKAVSTIVYTPEHASLMAHGVRQLQRTTMDAVTRAYRVLAQDLDGVVPKQFEKLLTQLMQPTSTRPAIITSSSHQYFLLARNLSLAAGLPIMPVDDVEDFEAQKKAARAMVRVLLVLCSDIERMRKWCMQNMEMADDNM